MEILAGTRSGAGRVVGQARVWAEVECLFAQGGGACEVPADVQYSHGALGRLERIHLREAQGLLALSGLVVEVGQRDHVRGLEILPVGRQRLQRRDRLGRPPQVLETEGEHAPGVDVLGILGQDLLADVDRFLVLASLEELIDLLLPDDVGGDLELLGRHWQERTRQQHHHYYASQ